MSAASAAARAPVLVHDGREWSLTDGEQYSRPFSLQPV